MKSIYNFVLVMVRIFVFFFVPLSLFSQKIEINEPINTGTNMTVAILAVDSLIELGDTILALYKLDDLNYKDSNPYTHPNDFGIAGLTVWKGDRLAIAIWGNDNTSNKKDGFLNNEIINWSIVRNNRYIPAHMIYKMGENVWKPNGISIIDSLKIGC